MTGAPRTAESRQRIWIVPAPLVVWGLHFMASYITAALWCGKLADAAGGLGGARMLIAAYTVVALAVIAVFFWMGLTAHRLGDADLPHDADTSEDRHRFLGFATMLIGGLSFVAVIYSALAAVFAGTCQ